MLRLPTGCFAYPQGASLNNQIIPASAASVVRARPVVKISVTVISEGVALPVWVPASAAVRAMEALPGVA